MIKKEYYKSCDLFLTSSLDRKKKEYFNEYGYNLSHSQKEVNHYKEFCFTNQSNCQNKAKKIAK